MLGLWSVSSVALCAGEAPVARTVPALEFAGAERKAAEAHVALLSAPDAQARERAERSLALCGPAVRPLLEPLLKGADPNAAAAAARLLALPALAANLPRVRIVLERGAVEAVLFEDDAPNTVANFVQLAENRFYDGLDFHRVVEQFMIQGGDPTGTGRGGTGYRIADEIDAVALGLDKLTAKELAEQTGHPAPKATSGLTLKALYEKQGFTYTAGLKSHPVARGALAMFGPRPNANSSQFFIAQVECPWLNGRHTVFGQVVRGLEFVDTIRKGEKMLKVEVLFKRDHGYAVKKLEEK